MRTVSAQQLMNMGTRLRRFRHRGLLRTRHTLTSRPIHLHALELRRRPSEGRLEGYFDERVLQRVPRIRGFTPTRTAPRG
ncbi:hypothetical protein Scani_02710 [Streptomyces caniferus]|uniref:Uncharacterized protein n=1 Tax=Streptomyces caniferus TaxID=285557 RepID=A0A640RXQ3_9ACTN|nr:hypothetical protein Scani_02710 [Streptomyces caniferus]